MKNTRTNSPAPPSSKPSKARSTSKGTTTPPGKQKTTLAPTKKVNPWDAVSPNSLPPGKAKKTSPKEIRAQVKAWTPGHSPFFR